VEPPPFSVMNREERHLCAILYHLLMDTGNLLAFQEILGLEPRDDAEVFVEAAFVRDYFNWWREEYARLHQSREEFDDFCHKAFGINPGQPSEFRAPKGFLSLRRLWKKPQAFDNPHCALLPSLANMRFDILLLTPRTFAVIETKLHSPLQASQVYLQQVLGRILNRLPGYEQHKFHHFLVSRSIIHPRLRTALDRCEAEHKVPVGEPKAVSWQQVLDCLPRVRPREQKEIKGMLGLRV